MVPAPVYRIEPVGIELASSPPMSWLEITVPPKFNVDWPTRATRLQPTFFAADMESNERNQYR
jgi:hypothetical protein